MDLDAYFQRIGHDGARTATLATLRALVAAHTATIPFENLDVLLGVPIALDLPSLERKLVRQRRGGYCFEQNTLFAAVLRALGFDVTMLAARVLWRDPGGATPPRTHVLLRVECDSQPWLVDVGFGGYTPTTPLPMRSGVELATPQGVYRLMPAERGLELQMREDGEWRALNGFTGERQVAADCEMANFYVSNWPGSVFRQRLMMARATAAGRHALLDNQYSFRDAGGGIERRQLASPQAVRELISDVMGVAPPPDSAAFEDLMRRIAEGRTP